MMPDMEKVTYDIERCICHVPDACRDCSHYQGDQLDCMEKLLADALSLLKEHEAVEPKKGWFRNNLNILEEHWFCGKCDEELVGTGKYCANCGREVKWE